MKISKTTINYAEARNIELVIDADLVSFYNTEDDGEPMMTYSVNEETGEMFFKTNIWLNQEVKEELPNWINSEKQLRQVIQFVSESL